MSYINKLSIKFSALLENEGFARLAIASFCTNKIKSLEDISDIKTVVSEAVTNAIIHGYEGQNKGDVEINCVIENDTVVLEIIDNGIGIADIEEARKPFYTSKPELERSGMGFTVMEGFMDEMKIVSNVGEGTKVILTKKVSDI